MTTPQGTLERDGDRPAALQYNGERYVLINDRYRDSLKDSVLRAANGRINRDDIELYKQVGITPADFGYMGGNWEFWVAQNSDLKLTNQEVMNLRLAIKELGRISSILGTYGTRSSSYYRLSKTSQDLFRRIGVTPRDLQIGSTAESWDLY